MQLSLKSQLNFLIPFDVHPQTPYFTQAANYNYSQLYQPTKASPFYHYTNLHGIQKTDFFLQFMIQI